MASAVAVAKSLSGCRGRLSDAQFRRLESVAALVQVELEARGTEFSRIGLQAPVLDELFQHNGNLFRVVLLLQMCDLIGWQTDLL